MSGLLFSLLDLDRLALLYNAERAFSISLTLSEKGKVVFYPDHLKGLLFEARGRGEVPGAPSRTENRPEYVL